MDETRTPLRPGTGITIRTDAGTFPFRIKDIIGYGGSCIVYHGTAPVSPQNGGEVRTQIIKEFYPAGLAGITREGDGLLVPEAVREQFDRYRERFCGGITRYVQYYEDYSNYSSARPFLYGDANNTSYAVSDPSQGVVLDEVPHRKLDLFSISQIMYSICGAIENFHNNGLLYLDCKPENIFLYDLDGQYHIRLFDFDTVVSIRDIQSGACTGWSYSEGWSPPEQKNFHAGMGEVGPAADIFSIGAVFFFLLLGRRPEEEELHDVADRFFSWKSLPLLKNSSEPVRSLIQHIGEKTLQDSASRRYQNIRELKRDFQYLMAMNADSKNEALPVYVENLEKMLADVRQDLATRIDRLEGSVQETGDGIKDLQGGIAGLHKTLLRQNRKMIVIAAMLILLAGIGAVCFFLTGRGPVSTGVMNDDVNEHVLLQLANSSHQYEMGLQNWKRLDYVRADRDIREARDSISTQKAQSELDVARMNNSLGCLYLDMGKYQDAYDYLNAALVTFQDILGEDSLETYAVELSIAKYDYCTGNFEGSLAETQKILDHAGTEQDKVVLAGANHLRAQILDAQGRYEEALSLYSGVLAMYDDILENGVLAQRLANYANDTKLSQKEKDAYTNAIGWIVLTYHYIAEVEIHKGDYEAAADAARTGLSMSLDNIYIGRRNLTSSKLYMSLAKAEAALGNLDEGLDDIDLAMRIQMNLFDFEEVYPGLVEVYDGYGSILEQKDDAGQALEYYRKAISLAADSYTENHPQTAAAYAACGGYYLRQGELDLSIASLEKAVEIRKNVLAETHPDTAEMYAALALAQEKAGLTDASRANLQKADDIFRKCGVSR